MLNSLTGLRPKETGAPPKPVRVAEGSDTKIGKVILTILSFLGPPALLFLYYHTMFPGLTNSDAMDYAQIGRNLSSGHGFSTLILRPLALTHGADPLHQPDVTHGPLFPFLLALAFGIFGAKDSVCAGVSGIFYLLTIPAVYILGLRIFGRAVAVATALIFTFNGLMLEYATSGLPLSLQIFLTTCLLVVMYDLAVYERDRQEGLPRPFPTLWLVLAGALTALLYLTDSIFAWVAPVVVGSVVWLFPRARGKAIAYCCGALILIAGPWMVRDAVLTGNPIFGLRGMEVWMNTPAGYYPGFQLYRMTFDSISPGLGLFLAVVRKMLLGVGVVIESFPQVTASWILAFLLPSLFFRFTDNAATVLRTVMMLIFGVLLLGNLSFGIQMPLFTALLPAMLVFSVAYLQYLFQQARLNRMQFTLTLILLGIVVIYPLLSNMTLVDKPKPVPQRASALWLGDAKNTQPDEISFSDQPWIVAWFSDRPSIWIPDDDKQVAALRQRFPTTRWLFLTDGARQLSPEWETVQTAFEQWNIRWAQAKRAQQPAPPPLSVSGTAAPLFVSLNGFESVPPTQGAVLSTVIAVTPPNVGHGAANSVLVK